MFGEHPHQIIVVFISIDFLSKPDTHEVLITNVKAHLVIKAFGEFVETLHFNNGNLRIDSSDYVSGFWWAQVINELPREVWDDVPHVLLFFSTSGFRNGYYTRFDDGQLCVSRNIISSKCIWVVCDEWCKTVVSIGDVEAWIGPNIAKAGIGVYVHIRFVIL
jgi:hypothetical protein